MTTTRTHLTGEPGVRFGIANGVLVTALLLCGLVRLNTEETEFLAVLVAGLASAGLTLAMTAWIGTVAWALVTGFVTNAYGELTFTTADLTRLALFAISTVALAVLAQRLHVVVRENAQE